jgi:hypothetical protein
VSVEEIDEALAILDAALASVETTHRATEPVSADATT